MFIVEKHAKQFVGQSCSVHLLYTVTICTVGLCHTMAANYEPTHQINYYYPGY